MNKSIDFISVTDNNDSEITLEAFENANKEIFIVINQLCDYVVLSKYQIAALIKFANKHYGESDE